MKLHKACVNYVIIPNAKIIISEQSDNGFHLITQQYLFL